MQKKFNFVKILTAVSTATLLGACGTQAPAPCVAPESRTAGPVEEQTASQAVEPSANSVASSPAQEQRAVSKPAAAETVNLEQKKEPAVTPQQPVQETTEQQAAPQAETVRPVIDPYEAIPEMVSRIFDYADTLFKQGNVDGAVSYLQRFRILKPLWNDWSSRADSLLNVFGMSNAERAKQYEPLVLEIKNMNRVNAAYSLVTEVIDSLIALAPGDSLTNFANEQKQIAYKNTLGKALKDKAQILAMAEEKARFEDALKLANEFQMRYRDFESELHINDLIAYIQRLASSISDEDQKYWEKNDPEKALADVDTLIEKKSYEKAKILVERLRASKLRKEAAAKYQKLADAVCTEKRKAASQLYSKAVKQKDAVKKKQILTDAIGSLTACSDEYPEYEKIKTVTDNITFLKAELGR